MTANEDAIGDVEGTLRTLAADIAACQRCDLYLHARQAVGGSGSPVAEVMLVAEAPSGYDERRGYPFSGPSGVFLDELLVVAGLDRASVYLTNVLKHRVPDGRQATPEEVTACAFWLEAEIAAVNPLVIVALGRLAASRFIRGARISAIHGQARAVGGRIIVPMYNPAAALHQEALRATVVDDFRRALPAALAEARRLAAEGRIGLPDAGTETPPQQMSLF